MKKIPTSLKDGLVGLAIGTAIIIPGISGGTIALIFGAFKKITTAVGNLFKSFWKSLLLLLPFGIGAVLAIAGLYVPFQYAFEYCMFAIITLFAGFILGSIPSVVDGVKGEKPTVINAVLLIVGLAVATCIGVFSVLWDFNQSVTDLFTNHEWYLFLIIFVVGIISSTGLIVPGLSGSLILLVIGFYQPIFNLPSLIIQNKNLWVNLGLLFVFAIGVLIGFIIFSKIMSYLLDKHKKSTYYTIIGFIVGSLVSIYVNSNMFAYLGNGHDHLLDWILAPIFFIIGLAISIVMHIYIIKHPSKEEKEIVENA